MDELQKYWDERAPMKPGPIVAVAATRVPLSRIFELPTEGRDPRIDAISICQELLNEMQPYERRAVLAYLAATVVA